MFDEKVSRLDSLPRKNAKFSTGRNMWANLGSYGLIYNG